MFSTTLTRFLTLVLFLLISMGKCESFLQAMSNRLISFARVTKAAATQKTTALAAQGVNLMKPSGKYPLKGDEALMSPKAHGTAPAPVQKSLRWKVDYDTADRICCFNRHYAEHAGYFAESKDFLQEMEKGEEITFYDSVTGKPLFVAPRGRTMDEFKKESRSHGWPSFRDDEVVWENMRCLADGESVSVDGTHLGRSSYTPLMSSDSV